MSESEDSSPKYRLVKNLPLLVGGGHIHKELNVGSIGKLTNRPNSENNGLISVKFDNGIECWVAESDLELI